MPAADDRDRCFGRPEYADMLVARSGLGEVTAIGFGGVPLICGDDQPCQPTKRRIAGTLALFDFVFVEGLAIAGDKRAHNRMLRLVGLQVPDAPSCLPSCAPNHLMQQLKCSLGGTGVAVTQAEIGVDDADQIELGKMVPFRDKLRADDEIEASFSNVVELLPETLDRLHEIARQNQNPCLREQLSRFLLEPLHTGADRSKALSSLTVRTFRRRRDRISAVVTHQPALEAMIDQPGIAIRALKTEPAGPAQCEGRIAAPVEKQQRLLAPRQ